MSIKIATGAVPRPQKVVLYGVEGIGKTLLAAQFPNPLFIDTEGGTEAYDVARTPRPMSWTALKDDLRAIAAERPCGTLVLDTADWAERLLCDELCAKNKWASMESMPYGKAWQFALEEFGRMLDLLTDVRDRGMNVVVTAHAMVSKFDKPDEATSYDRWTMKMYKKDAALLKEWADALLFLNYKTIVEVVGDGFAAKGKARGAKRTVFATHQAAWDGKNRWGLPDEFPLDYGPIAPHVPCLGPDPRASAPQQDGTSGDAEGSMRAEGLPEQWLPAAQLMERDGVSLGEVLRFAALQGHFTIDTPPENYPPEYVAGFIVPQWDQVRAKVAEYRAGEDIPF